MATAEEALPAGQPTPADQRIDGEPNREPVSARELNAWRRGFTPQAEIWNGRLAMLGLSLGLAVLLIVRLATA
ncbi:MAG: chlorophyll a/b-binding protein [Cyanobium sp.]|nr:chlorophyll a/b-binding protein [Cyanobium sp.]